MPTPGRGARAGRGRSNGQARAAAVAARAATAARTPPRPCSELVWTARICQFRLEERCAPSPRKSPAGKGAVAGAKTLARRENASPRPPTTSPRDHSLGPTNPMPAPALHPPQPPSQKVRCPGWAEGPGTHTLTPFPYPACSRLISRSGGLGGRERAATPRRAAHRRRAGASAWGVCGSSLGG